MTRPHQDLEEMIADINCAGFRLNNLFQCADGSWQCNIRLPLSDMPAGWGRGPTIREALERALANAKAIMPKKPANDPRQMPLPLGDDGVFA